jgi:AcrR family transcriptional regulator
VSTPAAKAPETRGRPRLRSDAEIMAAALAAFAEHGYETMSLRTLNAELGLSSGTINQRFGSKEQLWYAAVDNGFRALLDDINAELQRSPPAADDAAQLRASIRAFLMASVRHPELVRLMNQEGLHATARLDHIFETFMMPVMAASMTALRSLSAAEHAAPVSARMLLFLVAHGAAAPFTLQPLSRRFDCVDGALDPVPYVEAVTDVIVRGVTGPPG